MVNFNKAQLLVEKQKNKEEAVASSSFTPNSSRDLYKNPDRNGLRYTGAIV
jgi:hypothetical protein